MTEESENQESEDEVDQEAMMAEWEAMADEGDESEDETGAESVGSTRVLDQGEIDSLLGVDDDGLPLGLAGMGVYFSGLADSLFGAEEHEGELLSQEEEDSPSVYYDIPDMLVNLNSSGRKTGYLKISISVEVGSEEDAGRLETVLPRIVDSFQVYLRELRVEDLSGSAGLQRLREELLTRVSNAAAPTVVRDILFREMLIQ